MTIFFRLLESDDKGTALHQAIQQLAQQQPNPITFAVEPESFQQVPKSPFAYWTSEKVRHFFVEYADKEINHEARCGMGTLDNFRFLRLNWEIPKLLLEKRYIRYAKGGQFSFFYSDIYIVLNWGIDGREVKQFVEQRVGSASRKIQAESYYFRQGLTYSSRSQKGLSIRVMPQRCIFSDKGSAVFHKSDDLEELLALLAILNSTTFRFLIDLQMTFGSYEVGTIQSTPIPDLEKDTLRVLANWSRNAWSLKRNLDTVTQTSHAFVLPALLQVNGSSLSDRAQTWANHIAEVEAQLTQIQTEIDELAFELYDIGESDRLSVSSSPIATSSDDQTDEEDESLEAIADPLSLTKEMLAYALGVAIGRFDVRLVTGDRELPAEPEPFDPLPVCSPGMLVDENGLPPTEARSLPADYAIVIPFNGILVDDEGHPNDIIRHLRDVLKIIWGDQDSDIEQETCDLLKNSSLKVSSLRDYFRKPAAFFNDHLSRYSKSRRQAPLYLPLSTRSSSYSTFHFYGVQ